MTIEEAKQLKLDTERKISELILEFQNKTKLRVVSLYVSSRTVRGDPSYPIAYLTIAW